MKNYYDILKVNQSATAEEIKKAYYSLAKKCHPDTHGNDPEKIRMFNEITEAFDFLSNPINRMGLDSELHMMEEKEKRERAEKEKEDFFRRMKESGFDEKKNAEYIALLNSQLEEYEKLIEELLEKGCTDKKEKYAYLRTIRQNKMKRNPD